MTKKKQCPIQMFRETYDKLAYMAKSQGKSMAVFERELIDNLFQIMACFKTCNVEYEISVLNSTITIRVTGNSRISLGLQGLPEGMEKQIREAFGYVDGKDTTEKEES
jgi:hypothetical protein